MRFYDFLSYLCIMTSELSILIPCHDYICKPLVEQLALQASSVEGLRYEIIVIDDGSTAARMVEVNRSISRMPFCRHIALTENQGRSKVRNLLAREAKYECLLFIDCKHSLPDGEFIRRYVEASDNDVVDGGIIIQGDPHLLRGNLRFLYEKSAEAAHTVEKRREDEYRDFHTANFMARRIVMNRCCFDETITRYGYEDVLFGKQLRAEGIRITHIANPVGFGHFDSNKSFVSKTEDGMLTLLENADKLEGYSTLLYIYNKVGAFHLHWLLRLVHRLLGKLMRKNLIGRKPSLAVFKIYKITYFASLHHS